MTRGGRLWLTYGSLALVCAAGALALVLTSDHEQGAVTTLVLGGVVGLSFIFAGIYGAWRRPGNATGKILAGVGFAFFAWALAEANASLPFTLGIAVRELFLAVFVHLLLAYPTGRLASRFERRLVALAYVLSVAYPVAYLLFARTPITCSDCPSNAFLLHESDGLARAVEVAGTISAAGIFITTIALLIRRWQSASVAYRRSFRLVLWSGGTAAGLFVVTLSLEPLLPHAGDVILEAATGVAFVCVPFAFVAGLMRSRLAGAAVGRMVRELGPAPAPGQLRDALREVLHDPTLELGYWLPELPGFVDIEGRPFDPTERGVATYVDGEEGRIGVLVHDSALGAEPEYLDGVVAAVRLALENERLHAELQAKLAELEHERDFTRLVVDTAPALHVVVDSDGCVRELNDRALELLGISDMSVVHERPFWELFAPPDDAEHTRRRLAFVAAGQPGEVFENTLVCANGQRRRIEWRTSMALDQRRQLEWLILSGLDVTERRWHEDIQSAVGRVATLVAAEPSVEEVLTAVTHEVGQLFESDVATIGRVEGDLFRIIGGWSAPGAQPYEVGRTFPYHGDTATMLALQTRTPQRTEEVHHPLARDLWEQLGVRSAIAAPIVVNGAIWGAISASLTRDASFQPDSEHRLGEFASLVAQAIANAEARRALAGVAEEQAALRRVATLVARGAGEDDLLAAVTKEVGQLFRAQSANTMRWDGETVRVIGGWRAAGEEATQVGRVFSFGGDTVSARVVRTASAARIDSIDEIETELARELWREAGYHAAIGAPIIVDGEVWGVMFAARRHPGDPFPPGAERRLGDFAALIAQAVANAEARREVAALAEEQAALRRVATLVAAGRSEEDVLEAVATEAGALFGAEAVNLVRWFGIPDTVEILGGWSRGDGGLPTGAHYRTPAMNPTIRVLETGLASVGVEGGEAQLEPARADEWRPVGPKCVISAPVIVNGSLWGAMTSGRAADEPFATGSEIRLKSFAGLMAQAIANAEAREALRASRARLVEAGDSARRKLERNLHDGAQQRLVAISISMRLALAKLPRAPDEAQMLLAAASDELTHALDELRELARGIHPAILTDRGLGPALEALAGRAPLPVEVDHDLAERLPPPVEAAAYYVVSESLANIAKYAQASAVEVRVSRRDSIARVEVVDDGIGGADPTQGTGLRGLADRVEALDGRLGVESAPAAGTRVWAEIPLM